MATVANVRDQLERLKRDISDVPSDTFIEWMDYVNRYAYRVMTDVDPERWISTQSYTVSASPQTSSLPTDFESIQYWGTGFYYQDDNAEATSRRLTKTRYGARTSGYYITGDNVVFTGIDAPTTYVLRYVPQLAQLTATSDNVVIPDRYNNYMVKAVAVMYEQWDEQPGAESLADIKFMRVLEELSNNLRKEPQAYGMDDFSRSF